MTDLNGNGDIPYQAIWGIYYGKEDPFDLDQSSGFWYNNMANVSKYIHNKGKRLLWAPYTVCSADNLERIGQIANHELADGYDMCDVIEIQPGYYYYEVSNNDEQTIIDFIEGDLKTSFENNCVYISDSPVGGEKETKTKIILEVEYDASIFTGRINRTTSRLSNISNKVNRFLKTVDTYKEIVYDDRTSFGTYSGGPNEQDYEYITLTQDEDQNNYNKHSNRNHSTLLEESGEIMYYEFYGYLFEKYTYFSTYNVNILYDITKGILYDEWSDDLLEYLNNGQFTCYNEDNVLISEGIVTLGSLK